MFQSSPDNASAIRECRRGLPSKPLCMPRLGPPADGRVWFASAVAASPVLDICEMHQVLVRLRRLCQEKASAIRECRSGLPSQSKQLRGQGASVAVGHIDFGRFGFRDTQASAFVRELVWGVPPSPPSFEIFSEGFDNDVEARRQGSGDSGVPRRFPQQTQSDLHNLRVGLACPASERGGRCAATQNLCSIIAMSALACLGVACPGF